MAMPQWTRGVTAAVALSAPLSLMALLSPASAEAAAPGAALRVLTPRSGEALGSATFNLDVSFQTTGKKGVVAAEVWVDGVRWLHRDLDQVKERGVLSFAIDASTLSEGQHSVVVNVLDTTGSWTSTSVNVVAGNNAGVETGSLGGPEIRFNNLQNGKSVSSTVDVSVDASSRDGKNPYVSFFINKEFKTLKNYPPYSYTWDTTTVENGWHTVEALGFTDDQSKSTTSRKIRVYVDNPGGNTKRQSDIPDLNKPAAPVADTVPQPRVNAVAKTPLVIPTPGARVPAPAVVKPAAPSLLSPAATVRPTAVAGTVQMAKVDFPKLSLMPSVDPVAAQPAMPRTIASAHLAGRVASVVAPGALGIQGYPSTGSVSGVALRVVVPAGMVAATPVQDAPKRQEVRTAPLQTFDMTPTIGGPMLVTPVLPATRAVAKTAAARVGAPVIAATVTPVPMQVAAAPVRIRQTEPAAATPALPTARVETKKAVQAKPVAAKPVVKATKPASRRNAAVKPAARPADGAIQIAFDGDLIAFDVQPRVEAGLPLAPFRQIFEHTGGQVTWVPSTRVVRAINAEREIVLRDGQKDARVNDETVRMEAAMFIDRGRTIVPLSFVGKALDVNVQYDPATGRLQITSK